MTHLLDRHLALGASGQTHAFVDISHSAVGAVRFGSRRGVYYVTKIRRNQMNEI